MKNFFQFLEEKALDKKNADKTISRLSNKSLRDLAEEIAAKVDHVDEHTTSQFGFIANSPLSGSVNPCFALECRLEHVDRLARFAVLYSDKVLVQDPSKEYSHVNASEVGFLKLRLINDIAVLHALRPLFEVGLLGIARRATAFCEEHIPQNHQERRFEKGRGCSSARVFAQIGNHSRKGTDGR
jgi:hypothetical protein